MTVEHQSRRASGERSSGSLILDNWLQNLAFTPDSSFLSAAITRYSVSISWYLHSIRSLGIREISKQTVQILQPDVWFMFVCCCIFVIDTFLFLPFVPLESPSGRCSCWGLVLWSTRTLPRCRGRRRCLQNHRINTTVGGQPNPCIDTVSPADPSFTHTHSLSLSRSLSSATVQAGKSTFWKLCV